MPNKDIHIALLSPAKNAYSETFIQVHKERLKGEIFYYFAGDLPAELEGGLVINSRRKRILEIIRGHFKLNRFSLQEQALITSFHKNNIELVFAEYGGTAQRIIPVCKELKLPLIVHFHGFDAYRKDQLEENDNYKEVFNYATFVIAVSKKMEQDLLNLGCPREKLIYNVYGPREEFFEVNPQFFKSQFISIGRFVNKKAPYYLILAFREVVRKFPNAKLIMAGEGELLNTCKNLVTFYKLNKNISFVGVIDSMQFMSYLSESIALVQHSITAEDGDSEGTPLSILEAGAAGLPVISTYHAGIPDVIGHEITGLLVKEHDVEGMTTQMIRLLEKPGMAREMGQNSRKNIIRDFSIERHIQKLNELVKEASGKA